MPSYFYLDGDNTGRHRYDLSRFVEVRSGVHDVMTSYLLSKLADLPSVGEYRIDVEARPDIYSRDIYGSTDFWQLLLGYNDVVLVDSLTPGGRLAYFSLDDLDGLYQTLSRLRTPARRAV